MGNSSSELTKSELETYLKLTYLSKKEILHAFSRFKEISPRLVANDKNARIPFSRIKRIPEFQNNPFADRIGIVFSSFDDGSWSFEDFLDMASVLSESAPMKSKIPYAFKIYDFDDDDLLSSDDIAQMLKKLVGRNRLSEQEMKTLVEKIFQEADLDKDGYLSPAEFEHMMFKCPDFVSSFSLRL